LLAAEPAPVSPTPQEVDEEAAKAALEPTEIQRETGNRPNEHSRLAISTLRSKKRPCGLKKIFHIYFFVRAEK
jgi:hypothetical protein